MSKNRITLPFLALVLAASPLLYSQEAAPESTEQLEVSSTDMFPIMHPDAKERSTWHLEHRSLKETNYDIPLHYQLQQARMAGATAQFSLLPYLSYTPSQWNQGNCGDCWMWGSTAAVSIASGVRTGTPALFSIQYMNSSYTTSNPCCGGTAGKFATWYNSVKKLIPWSNQNASYADGGRKCGYASGVSASSISTTPNVPLSTITATSVTTTGVGQATAIANIKNVLNQNKAIAFSYMLPTGTGWTNFSTFWRDSSQDTVFKIDNYSGLTWDNNSGGGHLVCLVGYDDSDSTWIMLNSWGASTNRPAGTFKIPQKMNYDSYYVDGGYQYPEFYFSPYEITWPDSPNTVNASIPTPASNLTIPTGTSQSFVGTASGSSPNATLSYSWNFGDGGNAVGASANHTFTNTGADPISYTVTLTATDNTGAKGTATRIITVNPGTTPKVSATITTPAANVTIPTGTSQTFVGSAKGATSGATLNYSWNFGDGSSATGASSSHVYSNTGTSPVNYTATFTATDNTGAIGSATRTITVNPANGSGEKILNGGFENGATSWLGNTSCIGSSSSRAPHTGSKYAWLGGYGTTAYEYVKQTVAIPSTGGTLSFWLHVDSAETTTNKAYDTLAVQVCNTAGTVLGSVQYSNLNKGNGFQQKQLNLVNFKGMTVQIRFLAIEDSGLQTSFVIDDISLR